MSLRVGFCLHAFAVILAVLGATAAIVGVSILLNRALSNYRTREVVISKNGLLIEDPCQSGDPRPEIFWSLVILGVTSFITFVVLLVNLLYARQAICGRDSASVADMFNLTSSQTLNGTNRAYAFFLVQFSLAAFLLASVAFVFVVFLFLNLPAEHACTTFTNVQFETQLSGALAATVLLSAVACAVSAFFLAVFCCFGCSGSNTYSRPPATPPTRRSGTARGL